MSRVFYTSDLHFNHQRVAEQRGCSTPDEHDDRLIDRINGVVTKRDQLWILGDLGMGSLGTVLDKASRLNGVKHLIMGNHDPVHPLNRGSHGKVRRYLDVFESVQLHDMHRIQGHKVMLSHFPYEGDHLDHDRFNEWRLRNEGYPLIHGHVHDLYAAKGLGLNVGVDQFPLPVNRDGRTIANWLEGVTR